MAEGPAASHPYLAYSSCQFSLTYLVNDLEDCPSPQHSLVTVLFLNQVVVSCMFLLSDPYIVLLECENLEECMSLWKIGNI